MWPEKDSFLKYGSKKFFLCHVDFWYLTLVSDKKLIFFVTSDSSKFLRWLAHSKVFVWLSEILNFNLSLWFLYWASNAWSLWSGGISFTKIDRQIWFENFSLLDFIQIFQANWENWVKLTLQCICTWWYISIGWSWTKIRLLCIEAVFFFLFLR